MTQAEIKAVARVNWVLRGDVECPYCQHYNDFIKVDEFWAYSKPGENIENFKYPCEMTCEKCKEEFHVTGSDY